MDLYRVTTVTATYAEPSTFRLESDSSEPKDAQSASILIQRLLLEAFFTGASVEIDFISGTNEIRRIHPFALGKEPIQLPPNKYSVSRLATQRMDDSQDEHLEAFLVKDEGSEVAYNIYDQLLQQVLEASFGHAANNPEGASLDIEFKGEEIAMLRLGKDPLPLHKDVRKSPDEGLDL